MRLEFTKRDEHHQSTSVIKTHIPVVVVAVCNDVETRWGRPATNFRPSSGGRDGEPDEVHVFLGMELTGWSRVYACL